jgi:hypothetical protein
MEPDEGLDVRLGFFEDQLTDLPCIIVCVRMGGEEMVCEDSTGGYVPGMACSTAEVEFERSRGTAWASLWVPGD